ncbi:MAG: hypothetical protein NZ518_06680, partial [Dehalococcoidia bacterium]|nr:hypothetical protein [Dehalococcoidia bacterium]
YSVLLAVHSVLRWVVVAGLVWWLVRAFIGRFGNGVWTASDRRLTVFTVIAMDLQVTVGLALYLFLSPATTSAFSNIGAAMANTQQRFWLVEHSVVMIVALIALHVGQVIIRRAKTDAGRFTRMAVTGVIAALLVLIAIPWPWGNPARPLLPFV